MKNLGADFEVYGKASNDLDDASQSKVPGHCGVALMWSKKIAHRTRIVECESDRICVLELFEACYSRSIFIIGVYLPQQRCTMTSYMDHLNELSSIINKVRNEGEVLIIGDFNVSFGCDIAPRFQGVTSSNGKQVVKLVKEYNLHIVDGSNEITSGPTYTFHVDGVGTSYIDHCIVSELLYRQVMWCNIHEDRPINTSDHLPISIGLGIENNPLTMKHVHKKESVAWNKVTADEI